MNRISVDTTTTMRRSRMSFQIVLLLLSLVTKGLAKNGTCFFRSGAVADPNFWESCNPNSDGETHCCYKDNHICLSNKLCFDNLYNHVIEGACTDSSWSDSACPQYCKNNPATLVGDVRQCSGSNDRWICGTNSTSCSNSFQIPQAFVDDRRAEAQSVFVNLPAYYTSARSGNTGAATGTVVTVTATATAAGAASASARAEGTGSTASTVGIAAGLGVPLGISLIALAATIWLLLRANKRVKELQNQSQKPQPQYSQYSTSNATPTTTQGHQQIIHESPGQYHPRADFNKGAAPGYYATPHEIDGTTR